MKSLFDSSVAKSLASDVEQRVYTSRLLGQEPKLVLHGGGNTSVKAMYVDIFGDEHAACYIKGSGWDLATIEPPGFAPVRLDTLQRLARLPELSDADMVAAQRAALLNASAPNPSVEAILHAYIPYKFVDHTHTEAMIILSNNPRGDDLIVQAYGKRVLVMPYVMPGFALAKLVYERTQAIDWSDYDGMVLMNHGLFTWGDTAQQSYERMIDLTTVAEDTLQQLGAINEPPTAGDPTVHEHAQPSSIVWMKYLRQAISGVSNQPMVGVVCDDPWVLALGQSPNVEAVTGRGPLTPDHVIRTKRTPAMVDISEPMKIGLSIEQYALQYRRYFEANASNQTILDVAPRWTIASNGISHAWGRSLKEAQIVRDIVSQTARAILTAESIGGWQALSSKDIFDVEYWSLEQAKLGKSGVPPQLQGLVAVVTGAASGIGRASAAVLRAAGAVVVGVDCDPSIDQCPVDLAICCDLTDAGAADMIVARSIRAFAGLDIVISNAGYFPASAAIETMNHDMWQQSLNVNLTTHQRLLQAATPALRASTHGRVVIVASKNVPAPGPGQAAYSVAKAGLTQLARVAALELGNDGVTVNVVHPDAVYDTAVWSDEILAQRAAAYGITVEEYQSKSVLGRAPTSASVAADILALCVGFAHTTGAQIPIDGGNERVI